MRRLFPAVLMLTATVVFAQKQPFDASALFSLKRISDPQLSRDGQTVAFTVQSVDMAANKKPQQIWTVPLSGGAPKLITHEGENNQRPRWLPGSKRIAYVSDRGGSQQIWIMDADGGNAKQVTSLATGADGVLVSPDGKNLLFTSSVYPDCGASDACNKKQIEAEKESKVSARIYTELLYRHWNEWQGKRRSHLFAIPVEGGKAIDLTPGQFDVPPFSLGGPDDYDISPDGSEVCYVLNNEASQATSTNSDLYVVPIKGGESKRITETAGADVSPRYSPDGKYIGFRAQMRAGYESDRFRLMVIERSSERVTNLTENLDRWVSSFAWSPDSRTLFYTIADRGRQSIQRVPVTGGSSHQVAGGDNELDDVQFTPDGKTMVYTQVSGSAPVEIYKAVSTGGTPVALTRMNDAALSAHQMTPLEEFTVASSDGAQVNGFLVKPYGFDATRKYPVLLLIHGGPQGNWGYSWTYRWNAQVFAAAGYLVVMPNPRGSTGYGQKFIDEINGDWGGKAYEDIMAVTDYIVAKIPYADPARLTAAGGSYGGYMVNWLLGHTQRFKALISHAGVYDLPSEFGTTEELWFPLWEMGGTPWEKAEDYAKWSPSHYAADFSTPTLVIHGEQDFRVPYGQGLQLFTALRMKKVPAKLVVFPDEGHWVNKPRNAQLWYQTFIEWLDSWVKQ